MWCLQSGNDTHFNWAFFPLDIEYTETTHTEKSRLLQGCNIDLLAHHKLVTMYKRIPQGCNNLVTTLYNVTCYKLVATILLCRPWAQLNPKIWFMARVATPLPIFTSNSKGNQVWLCDCCCTPPAPYDPNNANTKDAAMTLEMGKDWLQA